MNEYQTIDSETEVYRDGTIKLHGPDGFEGMRKAGRLAAEILDARRRVGCAIERTLHETFQAEPKLQDVGYINLKLLPEIDRQFLVERQLISREHADSNGARAVAIHPEEEIIEVWSGRRKHTFNFMESENKVIRIGKP
mgnify:CR=1 FL=1